MANKKVSQMEPPIPLVVVLVVPSDSLFCLPSVVVLPVWSAVPSVVPIVLLIVFAILSPCVLPALIKIADAPAFQLLLVVFVSPTDELSDVP